MPLTKKQLDWVTTALGLGIALVVGLSSQGVIEPELSGTILTVLISIEGYLINKSGE